MKSGWSPIDEQGKPHVRNTKNMPLEEKRLYECDDRIIDEPFKWIDFIIVCSLLTFATFVTSGYLIFCQD